MIVVDTNILVYLFLKSPYTENAKQALKQDSHWLAPFLWKSEFRSVIALYYRRKILSLEDLWKIVDSVEDFMSNREHPVDSKQVLSLAIVSGCTTYDCEFVSLARNLNLPLLTMDKKVLHAFPETALSLESFVSRF